MDAVTKTASFLGEAGDILATTLQLTQKATQFLGSLADHKNKEPRQLAVLGPLTEEKATDLVAYVVIDNYLPERNSVYTTIRHTGCVVEYAAIEEITHKLETAFDMIKGSCEPESNTDTPSERVLALSDSLQKSIRALRDPSALKASIDYEQLLSQVEDLNDSENILENEIRQCLEHVSRIIENNIIKERVIGSDAVVTQSDVWARLIMAGSIASHTQDHISHDANAVKDCVPHAEDNETYPQEDQGTQRKRVYNSVSVLYCALRYGGASIAEGVNRSVPFADVLKSLKACCHNADYSIYADIRFLRNLDRALYEALVGNIALNSYTDAQQILTRYLQDARTETNATKLHVPSLSGRRGNILLENIASTIFRKVVELDSSQQDESKNGTEQKEALIRSQSLQELAGLLRATGEQVDSSNTEIKRLMLLFANILTGNATDERLLLRPALKMLRCYSGILKHASPTVSTNLYDVSRRIAHINHVVTKTLRQYRPRVTNGIADGSDTESGRRNKKIKTVPATDIGVRDLLNKITNVHCLASEVCHLLKNEPLLTVILQELRKDTELTCHTELLHVSKLDETALARVFYGISKKVSLLLSQNIIVEASQKLRHIYETSKSTENNLCGICEAQCVEGDDARITYVMDKLILLDGAFISQTCTPSVDIRLFHVRMLVEGCIASLSTSDTENNLNLVMVTLTKALDLSSNIKEAKHAVYPTLRHCIETIYEILESKKQRGKGGIAAEQQESAVTLPERHPTNIDVTLANTLLSSVSSDGNNNDTSLITERVATGYDINKFAVWVSRLSDLSSEALLRMSSHPTMVHSTYPYGYASTARTSLLGLCPTNWQILERTSGLLSLFTLLMEDISMCEDPDIAAEKSCILYEGIEGLRIARSSSFTRHNNYVLMLVSTIISSANKIHSYKKVNSDTKKTKVSSFREEEGLSQLNNFTVDDVDFKFVTATNMQKASLRREEMHNTMTAECCTSTDNSSTDMDITRLDSAEASAVNREKPDYLMSNLKVRADVSVSPRLGCLITDLRNFIESTVSHEREGSTVYKEEEDKVAFLTDMQNALEAANRLNKMYVSIKHNERQNAHSLHKLSEAGSCLENITSEDGSKIKPTTAEIKQKLVHEAERVFAAISHAKTVGPIQNGKVISTFLNGASAIAIKIMSEVGQLAPRTRTRELSDNIECTKRFVNILEAALNGVALCEKSKSISRYASIETMQKCVAEARARLEYLNVNDLISECSVVPKVRESLFSCLESLYDFQHSSSNPGETGHVSDINTRASIMSCRAICYLLSNHVTQPNGSVSGTDAACPSEKMVQGLSRREICTVLTYEAALIAHEVQDENSDHSLKSLKNHLNDIAETCMLEQSYFLNPSIVTNKLQESYKLCIKVLKNLDKKEKGFISIQKTAMILSRALSLLGTPCDDMHSSLVSSGESVDIPFFPGEKVGQKNCEQELAGSTENSDSHEQSRPKNKIFSVINYIARIARKILGWLVVKTRGKEERRQEVISQIDSIQRHLLDLQQCTVEHTGKTTSNSHILQIAFDACERSTTLVTRAINSKNLTESLHAGCHLIGSSIIVQKASKMLSGKHTDLAVARLQTLHKEINRLKDSLRKSAVGKNPALHTLNNPNYSAFGGMVHATDSFITYEVMSAAMWYAADPVSELKNAIRKIRNCCPPGTILRVSPNIFPVLFTPHESFETLDVICKNCAVNDNDSGELQAVLDIFAQNIVHYSSRRTQLEAKFPTSFWKQLTCGSCKTPDLLTQFIKNSSIEKEISNIKKHLVPCDLDKILQSLCEVSESAQAIDFLLNRCYGGMLSKEVLLQISSSDHIDGQVRSLLEDFIKKEANCDHTLRKGTPATSKDSYPELFPGKHYIRKDIQYKETRTKGLWHKIFGLFSSKKRKSHCFSETLYTRTPQSRIEFDKDGNMSLRGRPLSIVTKEEGASRSVLHHHTDAECTPLHLRTQTYASGYECKETGCERQSAGDSDAHEHKATPAINVAHTDIERDNASQHNATDNGFLRDISVERSHDSNKQL